MVLEGRPHTPTPLERKKPNSCITHKQIQIRPHLCESGSCETFPLVCGICPPTWKRYTFYASLKFYHLCC